MKAGLLTLVPYKPMSGFTLVEIMVAMVILVIGLLGLSLMTVSVIRGNRKAGDLTVATNLCQAKVAQLKDINWEDLGNFGASGSSYDPSEKEEIGAIDGGMVQEGKYESQQGLNSKGETRDSMYERALTDETPPCFGSSKSDSKCSQWLDSQGPYKFIRTFVICRGDQYDETTGQPLTLSTTFEAPPVAGKLKPQVEPDCRVDPKKDTTRSQWLACKPEDISTKPGPDNTEKKIKVLCAWRSQDGVCSSVHLDTTVVPDNLGG